MGEADVYSIRNSSFFAFAMRQSNAKNWLGRFGFVFVAGLCTMTSVFAADPGVTKDTITIGVFGPRTGPANIYRLIDEGAIAVYNEVNAAGGIHGRKLKVIS